MQDQNQKNRQPGQGQQGMGSPDTNWQSQGSQANQATENNQGQDWDDNTEVDMPQQPRHKEEPVEGKGQNWNKSEGTNSGQGSQENVQGNRMGSDMGSNTGSGSMGSQSNQGEGMRGGSMSDQGTMSDQRGNKTSDKSGAQEKESDDYMRNDIGTSTSGSSGNNPSSDR